MIMKKLMMVLSLAVVVLLPLHSTNAAFSDVNNTYKPAVDHIVAEGYAQGINETQFGISNEIKRIDAAVMIARVNGFSADGNYPSAGFTDVPKNRQWAVNALAANQIMNGISTTTFGSYQTMSREQMAKVIALTYDLKATSMNIPFKDVLSTVKPYVAALLENDITQGKTSQTFGSKDSIKRGEFALFIYRAETIDSIEPPEVISVE